MGHKGRRRSPRRVLVVDDTEVIRCYLADLLEEDGYVVDTAADGESALDLLEAGASPDVILLDIMLPGQDGLSVLDRIRERGIDVPVIMISIVGQSTTIVDAMRRGASDYVTKPIDDRELFEAIRACLERESSSEAGAAAVRDAHDAVWHGAAMREIRDVIDRVSDTDVTVLIEGESGVGKEIVARAAHAASNRRDAAFVKVNCAALPEGLLESELFGYEKGAFTGAHGRKLGKFELAHRGTIFLDEIGEMSPGLQAKLLQVLQDSRFTRLGGNEEIHVDTRVVCATHQPLLEMIEDRRFREDLYFRLNVVSLKVPPLRERREEIAPLVDAFVRRYSGVYGRRLVAISDRLMEALMGHSFPGNVRELENLVKRVVVLGNEESVLAQLLDRGAQRRMGRDAFQALLEEIEETAGEVPLREVGRRAAIEVEREAISRVLDQTGWNRKQAAKRLGVSYKTLLHKIRDCELER